MSGDGTLSAFSASSGALLWNKTFPYARASWPSVASDGTAYMVLQSTYSMYALNSGSGGVKWAVQPSFSGYFQGDCTLTSSGSFVATFREGVAISYATSNAAQQWKAGSEFGDPSAVGAPAQDGAGNLYIVTSDNVQCINPSGGVRWSVSVPAFGVGISGPVLGSSLLYGIADNGVFALNQQQGAIAWRNTLPTVYDFQGNMALGPGDDTLYIGAELNSAFDDDPSAPRWQLFALDGSTGAVKWTYTLPAVVEGAAVDALGNVHVFCSYSGVALSPGGALLYTYELDEDVSVQAPPIIGKDGTLYLHTSKSYPTGFLTAYAPQPFKTGLTPGAIAGIVVGTLAGVGLIAAAAALYMHRTGRITIPFLPKYATTAMGEARPLLAAASGGGQLTSGGAPLAAAPQSSMDGQA